MQQVDKKMQQVDKKKYDSPRVVPLGTAAELTRTNNAVQLSDVPIGSPLQAGS